MILQVMRIDLCSPGVIIKMLLAVRSLGGLDGRCVCVCVCKDSGMQNFSSGTGRLIVGIIAKRTVRLVLCEIGERVA